MLERNNLGRSRNGIFYAEKNAKANVVKGKRSALREYKKVGLVDEKILEPVNAVENTIDKILKIKTISIKQGFKYAVEEIKQAIRNGNLYIKKNEIFAKSHYRIHTLKKTLKSKQGGRKYQTSIKISNYFKEDKS